MQDASLVGQTIMGYRVVEPLGSGSFGTVYRAVKDVGLGTFVRALKHIPVLTTDEYRSILSTMGGDEEKTDAYFASHLKMVADEVQTLSHLSGMDSRHIVRYYESDLVKDEEAKSYDVFVLMEYLQPFGGYDALPDTFTVGDVVDFGLQLLEGIGFCHANNVIHRDIKEANIFIADDGAYKIGDFGIAKDLSGGTSAMSVKGTPSSIAPEVYLGGGGSASYTRSVDLYSLGMVLYRLLNHGRNPFLPAFPQPFLPKDESEAFGRRLKGEVPPLPMMGGDALGEVVVRSLRGPEDRFQQAADFADALRAAAAITPDKVLDQGIHEAVASSFDLTMDVLPTDRSEMTVGVMPSMPVVEGQAAGQAQASQENQRLHDTKKAPIPAPDTEHAKTPPASPAAKNGLLGKALVAALCLVVGAGGGALALKFMSSPGNVTAGDAVHQAEGGEAEATSEDAAKAGATSGEDAKEATQKVPNPYKGKYGTWSDGVYVSESLGIRIEPRDVIQPYYDAPVEGDYPDFIYAWDYGDEGWGVATIFEAPDLAGIDAADLENQEDKSDLVPITLGSETWYRNVYETENGSETELYHSVGGKMVVIRIQDPVYGVFTKLFIDQVSAA